MPNHQTFRNLPLQLRAAVAMMGSFGVELDIGLLEVPTGTSTFQSSGQN